MPKYNASNAVVNAAEQAAALYHVPCFRMQSRVFTVLGAHQRPRPMFIGEWTGDTPSKINESTHEFTNKHRSGMADLLLFPEIRRHNSASPIAWPHPLWVECKSGTGVLGPEQIEFKEFVTSHHHFYLELHDSAEELIQWFDKMKILP